MNIAMNIFWLVVFCATLVMVRRDHKKSLDYQDSMAENVDKAHNSRKEIDDLFWEQNRILYTHIEHIAKLNEEIKHLKRKIANRDGQITKLKNKYDCEKPEDWREDEVRKVLASDADFLSAVRAYREFFECSLADAIYWCRAEHTRLNLTDGSKE